MSNIEKLGMGLGTRLDLPYLPFLILKASYRHLCGSAFCLIGIGVPDKVFGVVSRLGFVEDRLSEFSCVMKTERIGGVEFILLV